MSSGAVTTSAFYTLGRTIARLRRHFAGPAFGGGPSAAANPPEEGVFARQARQFTTAQVIVRCFYGFVLYYAVAECAEFPNLLSRMNFRPLWPIAWIALLQGSRAPAIAGVVAFYALACVAGAFFASYRAVRVLVFVGMLEYFSFRNSFGKIGHGTHLFVSLSLVLVFLPRDWHRRAAIASRHTRQETLLVFWACQAAVLLSYTMSGFDKLMGALYQMATGQTSAFSPGALGAHIANRLVQTHSHSLLGSFIIEHPYLTWPLMPLPIYLEFFAFWMAFRPALQRWWALALILFHVGTIFTLTITFPVACLLLALFFAQSPFAPATTRWRELAAGVPVFGQLLRLPLINGRRGAAWQPLSD